MNLLPFQEEAVKKTLDFARLNISNRKKLMQAGLPVTGVGRMSWDGLFPEANYSEIIAEGDTSVPNACICIPTGGGKTITGLTASIKILELLDTQLNFITWLVPSDAIYQQVVRDFSPGGSYYQAALSNFGKTLRLLTSSSVWTDDDLSTNKSITILLLSKGSLIRSEIKKSALLVYRNPDKVSSLAILRDNPDPSLYELIKSVKPVFVIDESHKTYTEIGRDFFKRTKLSSFILELSATPKHYDDQNFPNIIHNASGKDLIEHQLIKNPINYNATTGLEPRVLMENVIGLQRHLELKLRELQSPVIPRVLISTEFTSKAYEAKTYSVSSIKRILQDLGVNEEEVLVKSSETNELNDRNLDNTSDPAKYILTKTALMEGWDCKSVYIIVLLNRISAPITNFQIIGRGLRQPFRQYYPDAALNSLYILTNSGKHDESVGKLVSFLSENGLSDLGVTTSALKVPPKRISLNLVIDPWVHYLNFDYSVYEDLTFRSEVQSQILSNSSKIFDECTSQVDPELIRIQIDMESGATGPTEYVTLSLEDGGLYSPSGMERFRIRLFSRLRSFFTSSSAAIQMTDNICAYLKKDTPAIPSQQQFIDSVVSDIEKIRKEYINKQFTRILKSESSVDDGELSKFFGSTFSVLAEEDSPHISPFTECVLGNMPKSMFNGQELEYARFLDRLKEVSWLKTTPGFKINFPYPLGSFYPDFIVIPKVKKGKPEVTYYVETKGDHILKSDDSIFKNFACGEITKISKGRVNMVFGSFKSCEDRIRSAVSGGK